MTDIRLNWQNLNGRRSYPLEELASKLSDAGTRLPDDLLVGAKIRFPASLGDRACLNGLTVSSGFVTAVFVATDREMTKASIKPLAAVTVTKPALPGNPYAVTPMSPGVGGWVVFGDGILLDTVQSYRFSDPATTPVILSQARPYNPMAVPAIKKSGSSMELTGLVTVRGTGDIEVVSGYRDLPLVGTRKCMIFRLIAEQNPDVLREYAGPCAGVPESGTCDFVPISSISSVTPDSSGNITLQFDASQFFVETDAAKGEFKVNVPVSSAEICALKKQYSKPNGSIRVDGEDRCPSET